MKLWAVGITLFLLLFTTASLAMVWVAVKNPPVMVERVDEWAK